MMEKRAKVTKIKQFEFVNRKLSYKKKQTKKTAFYRKDS